jgi:hypothetical protein
VFIRRVHALPFETCFIDSPRLHADSSISFNASRQAYFLNVSLLISIPVSDFNGRFALSSAPLVDELPGLPPPHQPDVVFRAPSPQLTSSSSLRPAMSVSNMSQRERLSPDIVPTVQVVNRFIRPSGKIGRHGCLGLEMHRSISKS